MNIDNPVHASSLAKSLVSLVVASLLLPGCAADRHRYHSTYVLAGQTEELDGKTAEAAHVSATNSKGLGGASARFDRPLRLLRAPQPVMSPQDTDARVVGEVVVRVVFDEAGVVERVLVVRSTKESLSKSVVDAVSQWRIAPATRDGKPSKVVAQQAFDFKTDL